MIPIDTVLLLIVGAICFQIANLIGLVYLAIRTDPKPTKAGLMSELYRGRK